nr:S24 family peptidase [Psychrobacter sp. PraFG1]UNK04384.1 S24 family peptidase [Psychrobacter sp. PraFG1]
MDNVRRVPVLNYVQAGEFCHYFDDAIADTFEIIIGDYPPHVHWVIIEGLSMTPDFNPGDLIWSIQTPSLHPVIMSLLKAGENAVTFKKWRPRGFDDNGVEYCELVPLNPDFPTIDSRHTPFTICGVAVEHKKKLK